MDIVEVLRLAAISAYAAGELERSVALYDEALAELEASDETERIASVLVAKAAPLTDLGREEATELLERAVSMLPRSRPRSPGQQPWSSSSAGASRLRGPIRLPAAEQALAAAQAAGAREGEAMARMWLGICRTYLGDDRGGIAELRRAVELAEELGAHALMLGPISTCRTRWR